MSVMTADPATVATACEIAAVNPPAEEILAGALFGEAAQTIRQLMPTDRWWAQRWFDKATPGEREAMRNLLLQDDGK